MIQSHLSFCRLVVLTVQFELMVSISGEVARGKVGVLEVS